MLLLTYATHTALALNKMLFCYSFYFGIQHGRKTQGCSKYEECQSKFSFHYPLLSPYIKAVVAYSSALLFPLIWDEGDAGAEGPGGRWVGYLAWDQETKR